MNKQMHEYFKSCRTDHESIPYSHKNLPLPRHNVIWFVSDQHRAHAISMNGDVNVNTPNLDNMIIEGVNFNKAVSCFPLCCPFRATMLTGLDHQDCLRGHEYAMPEGVKTIADAFNENGYDTAYFGKWHVNGNRDVAMQNIVPKHRRGGFNTWIGYENNNNQYNTWVHGHDENGNEIEQYKLDGFETDILTDLLLDYINKRQDDKPFFAVVSVQPPHIPLVAPAENRKKYKFNDIKLRDNVPNYTAFREKTQHDLSGYYAMIENIDDNIGRVKEGLRKSEIDLNTHLMYFSDHGDMMGSQGLGGKILPYEESIRIPFIISHPPGAYYGFKTGTVDALMTEHDIAATTLGLCGIKKPEWLGGYDYSHYRFMENADEQERPPVKEDEPKYAFIKTTIPRGGCDKAWRGVVSRDGFKYVCQENSEWLLYNLNTDPLEQINLAHNVGMKGKRRELLAVLKEYVNNTGDNFVLPKIY